MPINSQKQLKFERSDTTSNENIIQFYDSTDSIWISNYVLIKSDLTNITINLPVIQSQKAANIGQEFQKENDLNAFVEESRNGWISRDFEKALFDLKNQQTYAHGDNVDIYNRFENYLDSTTISLVRLDLSTFINSHDNNTQLTEILPQTENCFVKHLFNVYSVEPLHKNDTSYSEALNYYNTQIQSYFKPNVSMMRSSISINRFLYDKFYKNNRKSFLLFDLSNDIDFVSVYFYDIKFDNSFVVSLHKYDTRQAYLHEKINQKINTNEIFKNTDSTLFDYVQQNYTRNLGSEKSIGSINRVIAMDNHQVSSGHFVYSGIPNKWYCSGGIILQDTFNISEVTNLDQSNISSIEILDSKQYQQLDENTYSSLYTLKIVTTENKEIYVPISISLTSDITNSFSFSNILDKDSCTLFHQNELNSSFDGTNWNIDQEIFTITTALSLQTYDDTLGILYIDSTKLTISNDHTISIDSSDAILKICGNYINEYAIFDRNVMNIEDPQNYTLFDMFTDLSNIEYNDLLHTPFGGIRNKWWQSGGIKNQATTGSTLESFIYSSNGCKKSWYPCSSYQYEKAEDAFIIGTFGGSMRYDFQITDEDTNIRVYNFINNIRDNNDNENFLINYKAETFNYGLGPIGFYNSIINKMYVIDRTGGGDPYYHCFNIFDIRTASVKHIDFSCSNYMISTYPVGGGHVYQNVNADSTSIEFFGNKLAGGGISYSRMASTFTFGRGSAEYLKFNQKYQSMQNSGLFGNMEQNTYTYGSNTPYSLGDIINDNTLAFVDNNNNIYEVTFSDSQITGGGIPADSQFQSHTKINSKLTKLKQLYIPQNLFRVDSTTTQSIVANNTDVIKLDGDTVKFYNMDNALGSWGSEIINKDLFIPYNDSLFFSAGSKQLSEVTSGRYDITEDNFSIIFSVMAGQLKWVDSASVYLRPVNGNFYIYDINDATSTLLATRPTSNFQDILSQRKIGSYYYILGYDTDGTTQTFKKMSLDDTTWTIEQEWELLSSGFTGYDEELNFFNDHYFNFIDVNDDTVQFGYIVGDDKWFTFTLSDESAISCHSINNGHPYGYDPITKTQGNAAGNFQIDEEDDLDYKYVEFTNSKPTIINEQLCRMRDEAPFTFKEYDQDTSRMIFRKLWNAPFFDYMLVHTAQPSAFYVSNRISHQLMNSDRVYVTYNNNTELQKKPNLANIGRLTFSAFRYKSGISASTTGYTSGYKINDDVISFLYDNYDGVDHDNRSIGINKFNIPSQTKEISAHTFKGYEGSQENNYISMAQKYDASIYFITGGNVYNYNTVTGEVEQINIIKGNKIDTSGQYTWQLGIEDNQTNTMGIRAQDIRESSYVTNDYILTNAFMSRGDVAGGQYYCPYIYSFKRNRQFHLPINTKTRPDAYKMNAALYIGDNYLALFGLGFNYGYTTVNSGIFGANYDSLMLNKLDMFIPYGGNDYVKFFDDQSNLMYTSTDDRYIITHPKFYNNIFTPDICPETFNKYISSVHTCMDDTKQLLGAGMHQFKNEYDKIVIHKIILDNTTILRNAKINDEVSLNGDFLQPFFHNANQSGYTFNNDANYIRSNVYMTSIMDFTTTDYTKVDISTLYVSGNISMNQDIRLTYGSYDLGYSDDTNYYKDTTGNIQICNVVNTSEMVVQSKLNPPGNVNFSDITSSTVTEVNDYFIRITVTDGTGQSATIDFDNNKNIFDLFPNNKLNWLAYTSYFKYDDTKIVSFITLPELGKIATIDFTYNNNITETLGFITANYDSVFDNIGIISTIDTTKDLYYYVPLSYISDTEIMWMYNDAYHSLISLDMSTGNIINDYTDTIVRYKDVYNEKFFEIVYDEIYSSSYIRKKGVLSSNGELTNIISKDVLTENIIDNLSTDISDFTVYEYSKSIGITNGTVLVDNIKLGERVKFDKLNWCYDTSDVLYVGINTRNMNSHSYEEKILVINKIGQSYNIGSSRYETIYDRTDPLNKNQLINELIFSSNDIIRIKTANDYAFQPTIISFYSDAEKSIKYFDPINGFIYKLEDAIVYDGAFFYKNSATIPTQKEFAIWDKMHSSMQYHDDLPKIFFTQYEEKNLLCDYIYDSTYLYLFINLGPTIDQATAKIKIATCIDLNYNLSQQIDNTFLTDNFIEETVLDFTGLFPTAYLVLERLNRFKDVVTRNRFVKVTVDYTFDESGLIGLDTSNLEENPFGSLSIYQQQYESIEYLKTQGWYYNELLNDSNTINKRLAPSQDFGPSTFNTRTYSQSQPTGIFIDSNIVSDNTATISQYFDPLSTNMNYIILLMNMYDKYGLTEYDSTDTPLTYQKMYKANVNCRIKIRYNQEIFSIYDADVKTKVCEDYSDYQFGVYTSTIKPFDRFNVKFTPSEKKIQKWLSTEILDGDYQIRRNKHTIGVNETGFSGLFDDTIFSEYNITAYNQNNSDQTGYTYTSPYYGSVTIPYNIDRTEWDSSVYISEDINSLPRVCRFEFENEISPTSIIFRVNSHGIDWNQTYPYWPYDQYGPQLHIISRDSSGNIVEDSEYYGETIYDRVVIQKIGIYNYMLVSLNGNPFNNIIFAFGSNGGYGVYAYYTIDDAKFSVSEKDFQDKLTEISIAEIVSHHNPMTFDYDNTIFYDQTIRAYSGEIRNQYGYVIDSEIELSEYKTGFSQCNEGNQQDTTQIFGNKITIDPDGGLLFYTKNEGDAINPARSYLEFYNSSIDSSDTTADYVRFAQMTTNGLSVARQSPAGCGTIDNALAFGGWVYAYKSNYNVQTTDKQNGTSWANTGSLNQIRTEAAGCGNTSDALCFGGYHSSQLSSTEIWSGSSQATTSTMNEARYGLAGFGTTSDALSIGGASNSSTGERTTRVEKQTGSAQVTTTSISVAKYHLTGCGSTSDGIIFGGNSYYGTLATTEIQNGSAQSTTSSLNREKAYHGGCGTTSNALSFGGGQPGYGYNETEKYNGSSQATSSPLNVARWGVGGSGIGTDALSFGGRTGSGSYAYTVATSEKIQNYNYSIITLAQDSTNLIHKQYLDELYTYDKYDLNDRLANVHPLVANGSGIDGTQVTDRTNSITFDKMILRMQRYAQNVEYWIPMRVYHLDYIYDSTDFENKITKMAYYKQNNESGDIKIPPKFYRDQNILYTGQINNVDSTEYEIFIDPDLHYMWLDNSMSLFSAFSNTDSSIDATMFLLGIDGTYDITKYVENSQNEISMQIPENTLCIRIKNVIPENNKSIPVITVSSDSTSDIANIYPTIKINR